MDKGAVSKSMLTMVCEKFNNYSRLEINEEATFFKAKQIEENEIKDLKKIVSNLNDELSALQSCKERLEEELQENDIEKLYEQERAEKKELESLNAVAQGLEKDIAVINEEAKPLERDIAIIDKNRKILKTYKELTGVKWNYGVSSMCQGIVYNPAKDHLKHISYSMKETDKVWDEIENSGHATWKQKE